MHNHVKKGISPFLYLHPLVEPVEEDAVKAKAVKFKPSLGGGFSSSGKTSRPFLRGIN
jgi:hypothetical protein